MPSAIKMDVTAPPGNGNGVTISMPFASKRVSIQTTPMFVITPLSMVSGVPRIRLLSTTSDLTTLNSASKEVLSPTIREVLKISKLFTTVLELFLKQLHSFEYILKDTRPFLDTTLDAMPKDKTAVVLLPTFK